MPKKILRCFLFLALVPAAVAANRIEPFELTSEWVEKIRDRAPATATAEPTAEHKVLLFSLTTGFVHWCIPHTDAVVEVLGQKTGAYTTVRSTDIEQFLPENLSQYSAVVLNNNCPARGERDLFRDVLINKMEEFGAQYAAMSAKAREALAEKLYRSLVDYVADGGGLVLLHGAIANFSYSEEFSSLVGGSFDFHPPQQELSLYPVEPDHPMLEPFGGKPFVHYDEPYIMGGAYSDLNFRPLLEFNVDELTKSRGRLASLPDLPRYVAWIKPYRQGRVFYCSPSHNAQSFEQPELLAFILNGMQYALGDLACEDQP